MPARQTADGSHARFQLSKALAQFTASERLSKSNEYRCDGCHRTVAAEKQISLHTLPHVLTIQFKRFSFSA